MPTALVITPHRDYGAECFGAFRANDLFPVVVGTVDDALHLLKQFKADVLAVHASGGGPDEADRLRTCAPQTPLVVLQDLPDPPALASLLREAIGRGLENRAEWNGAPRAPSSSAEGPPSV